MKENFIKTIQGHKLQFNKQSFSGSYQISPANVEFKDVLSLKKDEKGVWNANKEGHLPAWFNEISMYIHYAIEENETRESVNSDFLRFTYPF